MTSFICSECGKQGRYNENKLLIPSIVCKPCCFNKGLPVQIPSYRGWDRWFHLNPWKNHASLLDWEVGARLCSEEAINDLPDWARTNIRAAQLGLGLPEAGPRKMQWEGSGCICFGPPVEGCPIHTSK